MDGRRLRYVDMGAGAGPPLLLVHGTGGSWQSWLLNLPELARRRRVIAVDMPGFGASDALPAGSKVAAYADALAALLDELEVERAVAVGHSLGGVVASRLAIGHPDRVAGLVLVDGGGVAISRARLRMVTLALIALHALMARRGIAGAIIRRPRLRRWILAGGLADAGVLTADLAREMMTTFASPGLVDAVRAGAQDDLVADLGRVRAPTLLLWGRRDRLIPLQHGEELARHVAGARLEVFDDAGHCPMIEAPAAFNAALLSFAGPLT